MKMLFTTIIFLTIIAAFAQPKKIDPLSAQSLRVVGIRDTVGISTATGFVVAHNGKHYLITNWHVVTGRDWRTGEPLLPKGVTPNRIGIYYNGKRLGDRVLGIEDLYTSGGKSRWLEHPLGKTVDVVAFPLSGVDENVVIYPLDLKMADVDMATMPGIPVSIIGFPNGQSAPNMFPIWKTGHIATDPDLGIDGLPAFLIDATTRGGMSGSPVVARLSSYQTKSGDQVVAAGFTTLFLGVYSAQDESQEIGVVWKPEVIMRIFPNE